VPAAHTVFMAKSSRPQGPMMMAGHSPPIS
jgi:hypothetical protein